MKQKRIKVRLTKNSPYSDYGYYEKGDIGYIDGYVNDNAVIILENGKFAKADLRWIEVVNEEDKNVNTELAESEDERISKHLLYHFRNKTKKEWNGMPVKDIIAYLEKQGEHKKFRDSIQVGDKVTKNEDGVLVNLSQLNRVAKKDEKQGEQKSVEWSKSDKRMLDEIVDFFENGTVKLQHDLSLYASWLKSLRPQSHWKPSDEQIECLSDAIEHYNSLGYPASKLKELLDDLKKLKE